MMETGHAPTLESAWSVASAIDIRNCTPEPNRNADAIEPIAMELRDLIKIKRFGDAPGADVGGDDCTAISTARFVAPSLIAGNGRLPHTVTLDASSCKPYPPATVRQFAQDFSGNSRSSLHATHKL